MATQKEPRYRKWEGNHIFCCRGYIMLGSNVKQLFVTITIIFLSYVYYYLSLRPTLQDFYENKIGELYGTIVAMLVPAVFFFTSLVSLLLTVLTEPGIVPKQLSSGKIRYLSDELRKFDRYSFCQTCNIMRDGARTIRHCRHCNACVSGLDHHCPWLGCCIGKRNYKLFVCFIGSMVMAYFWIFSHVILLVVELCSSSLFSGSSIVSATVGMFVSAVILCFTATLLGFHCYLMSVGLSTAQYFRPDVPNGNNTKDHKFPSVESLSNLSTVELGLLRMQSPVISRDLQIKSSTHSLSVDSFQSRQNGNFHKLANNESIPSGSATDTTTNDSEERDDGSIDTSFSSFSSFSAFSAFSVLQQNEDEVTCSCLLPSKLRPQHELDESTDRKELLKGRKVTKLLLQKQLLYHKFNEHRDIMSNSPLPLSDHRTLRKIGTVTVDGQCGKDAGYSGNGNLELDTSESVKA